MRIRTTVVQSSVLLLQTYTIMNGMNGMHQPHEGFTPASGQEMRISPDGPPVSHEERVLNQKKHDQIMAGALLAGKIFNTGDTDNDLKLWRRKDENGASLEEAFNDMWPAWREKHTKAVDGVALEAFLKESGLSEKVDQYRDTLDMAA